MEDIIKLDNVSELEMIRTETDFVKSTKAMLMDARTSLDSKTSLSVPNAELSTLGAGVSSLIPALNTVTQTTTFAAEGLYQLANAGVGDELKMAKNGNLWGALKTADDSSKLAQFQKARPLSGTTSSTAMNPATMMMAVALFSIEKELGNIADMEKQILAFLEIEKESEIEADVEILVNIINQYKFNWDNEHYVNSNHKLVLDIQ